MLRKMFNSVKSSDKAFTNVTVNNTLDVKNNIIFGDSKRKLTNEINSVSNTLIDSKNIVENFELKMDDLRREFAEFQKNRILTTQDLELKPVDLLSNDNITLDTQQSYIKVLCEDSLVNCDIHLCLNHVNTRFVYVKLPFPVLLQNYENEGIKQSQIIPGRIVIRYNNLRTTLSSVYIDINQYLDYVIIDSPFFVNDGSIFTDIETDISIKYTGDISSEINSITPMRYSHQNIQDDFKFFWKSDTLLNTKALFKWIVIKNKIDVFINISFTVTKTSFDSNTTLIGKLPMDAYMSDVDLVYNAVLSINGKYAIKPVQVVLKSTDNNHFYIYIPENIIELPHDQQEAQLSVYFTYYTRDELIQEQPIIIKYTSHLEKSNITFSNIDIFDSLNINNHLFFGNNHDLRFNIMNSNVLTSFTLSNITYEMLQQDYTFNGDFSENSTVFLTISNKRDETLVTSTTTNLT